MNFKDIQLRTLRHARKTGQTVTTEIHREVERSFIKITINGPHDVDVRNIKGERLDPHSSGAMELAGMILRGECQETPAFLLPGFSMPDDFT